MATLTVWKFPTADGAEQARGDAQGAAEAGADQDPRRRASSRGPRARRSRRPGSCNSLAGAGALGGAFWGCCSA